jgi:hypothetical protein
VLLLLERFWKLRTPSLIISVTGAAKSIQLDHGLAKLFEQVRSPSPKPEQT